MGIFSDEIECIECVEYGGFQDIYKKGSHSVCRAEEITKENQNI